MKSSTAPLAIIALLTALPIAACSREQSSSAARTDDQRGADGAVPKTEAQAVGMVDAVDLENRKVTISHEPIPEIGWPAMTMDFGVDERIDLPSLKAKEPIRFMLKADADGTYRVAAACLIGGDTEVHRAAMKSITTNDMPMKGMEVRAGAVMPCSLGPQ